MNIFDKKVKNFLVCGGNAINIYNKAGEKWLIIIKNIYIKKIYCNFYVFTLFYWASYMYLFHQKKLLRGDYRLGPKKNYFNKL